jgi:hypothetical protein
MEKLDSPSGFLSKGNHYISRFENIRGIIDLKDRMAVIPAFSVMTSDRVILDVSDFYVWYRIYSHKRDDKRSGGLQLDPYPFSIEALRSLQYNRFVSSDGESNWEKMVVDICASEITYFINSNDYETITSLSKDNILQEKTIQSILNSPMTRAALRKIGTEIIRHDFIKINISEDFKVDPKLNGWEDKWKGKAMVTQAEGEVKKLAYQEFGLVDSRVEILNELGAELADFDLEDSSEKNIKAVFSRIRGVLNQVS